MGCNTAASGGVGHRFVMGEAVLVLGTALFWPCVKEVPLFLVNSMGSSDATSGVSFLLVYALEILCILAGVFAVVRLSARQALVDPVHARVAYAAAGLLGAAGIYSIRGMSSALSASVIVSLSLISLFVGIYASAWARRLVCLSPARIPFMLAGSLALSELVKFAAALLGLDGFWFVLPVASCAALLACPLPDGTEGADPSSSPQTVHAFPWKILLPYLGFVVVWSASLGFSSEGALGSFSEADRLWTYGLSCAGLVALSAYFYVCLVRGFARRAFLYPLVILAIVYMLVLVWMLLQQQVDSFGTFKRTLVAVESCTGALALVVVMRTSAELHVRPYGPMAVYVVLLNGGSWMLVGELIKAMSPWSVSFTDNVSGVMLLFVTSIVLTLFLLGYGISADSDVRDKVAASPENRGCEEVSARYGLTEREREVMLLLYRGYSIKRTAEALGISASTVHSHSDAIYRKLGVHSKQELMMLVDAGLEK